MAEVVTLHVSIRGRVQGVGYREALRAMALRSGVAGWVRNRADGSVEATLSGSTAAVEALIAWAWHGPPAARVERVETGAGSGEFAGFERRPSA